jgi:hypothetical protein
MSMDYTSESESESEREGFEYHDNETLVYTTPA